MKTFSIGFDDEDYNELPHARLVAERFGTDHHEFVVEPDALELLPQLVRHYGEPFADPSAIPSFYLAELTRRHVTVALNGDGGDESFARLPALRRQRRWPSSSTGLPAGARARPPALGRVARRRGPRDTTGRRVARARWRRSR